jgi:hypothetical protein
VKVIVTGASQNGTEGEARGYTLSAEQHAGNQQGEQYLTGTVLSVRWRMGGNKASDLMEQLATSAATVWAEVEPDAFSKVETVSAEGGLGRRYHDKLIEDASGASLETAPDMS